MGIFNKKDGGILDVIRCDEDEYLIWKWRPFGCSLEESKKANSIRYGSKLRVKDGEVAVFVYPQENGTQQDYILGPYDETIKTQNFPILSNLAGLAFGGNSPFQAEIYFINLAGVIQVKFGVPYFDVFDPRYSDFAVPVAVRGVLNFKIADYKNFIKLHRLIEFDLEKFKVQIKDAVSKYIKGVVTNIPSENGIPVMQLERKILEVNNCVEAYVKPRLENDFGVDATGIDISDIECNKESDGYQQLKAVTTDIATKTAQAQASINIENMSETMRIQREEMQRAQKLQTESANLSAHLINQQTKVGIAGAESLGNMGAVSSISGGGDGMNPIGLMAGMAIGSAVGQNVAGTMNGMLQQVNSQQVVPPIPEAVMFNVVVNGQSAGPYDMGMMNHMIQSGQIVKETLVWKKGLQNWVRADSVPELVEFFGAAVPPIPAVPPTIS